MISPTGKGVRVWDKWGSGAFGASRDGGTRKHSGVDFVCFPGSVVFAPATGYMKRVARPYKAEDDQIGFEGVVLVAGNLEIKMFYFSPLRHLMFKEVEQGDIIGIAQDVSMRYPGCIPHVHLEIKGADGELVNPMSLIKLEQEGA